jgi:hypothetical protein
MALSDCRKDGLLKRVSLDGKVTGEDTFQSVFTGHSDRNVPVLKLMSINTDDTSAITGEKFERWRQGKFVSGYRRTNTSTPFLFYVSF